MKIEKIICQILRVESVQPKTASCQDVVLVRVRTDDGLEGVGEADASPEVIKAIIDAPFSHNIACGLREILIGENPLETERLWQKMYRRTMYYGRSSVTICAMSAVDMALWDLKGKYFKQPIHRLLGGKYHDRIKAYASILFGRDGKQTREIGQRWINAGYQAVKFGWEPMGQSEALDLELVRGARAGVGDGVTLLIDAGCVWDARTALRRAHAFAESGIEWLEEPLRPDDVDGYIWLRDRSPVPIAAGEQECGEVGVIADHDRLPRGGADPGRSPIDRPPRAGCLSGGPLAKWFHRRRLHPVASRGDRRASLQPLLHQPNHCRGEFALARHVPRCVHLRGLRGRLAHAPRTDA